MSPRAINAGPGHRSTPGTVKRCNSSYSGGLRALTVPTLHGSIASKSNPNGEVAWIRWQCSSTPLRSGLVALLGENTYLGLYTLVSLATLAWMIWAYVEAPYERLWVGDELKVWAVVLMPVSLVLIACGALTRNPSAVRQESALRSMGEPRGILRVTRHPILWGLALWAAVHLIARGDMASAILFGGLLLLAISGTVLQDWSKDRMIGVDWKRFAVTTSNFPFAAIMEGRNQFRFDEIGWWRVVAGLALYVLSMYLHPYVIGTRAY